MISYSDFCKKMFEIENEMDDIDFEDDVEHEVTITFEPVFLDDDIVAVIERHKCTCGEDNVFKMFTDGTDISEALRFDMGLDEGEL